VTPDLSVQLAKGLRLENPVMTSSGTFGYGIEYSQLFDIQRLGAIICKGTTLKPREGNPQPRLIETAYGMINSIGLQNVGVKAVIRDKAPIWAKWKVPVLVNLAGDVVEDYGELARELDGVKGVSALEVNISCPNVKAGGAAFGADPGCAAEVVKITKAATSLPLMFKLTPSAPDIVAVAKAVEAAGADAISMVNCYKGMSIDINNRKLVMANGVGGMSGPAIKPLAIALVYQVAGAVKIPVVGLGGIVTAEDALEYIMAGASAIQVGSATFNNPRAALDVLEGIQSFMEKEGIKSLKEIVGAARR